MDVVYHEAAVPSVARSVDDPALSHRANATATLTMLVAARDAGVRRFIYAGSSSVYGDAKHLPKREDMEPRPLSPYAVGKLVGEHYLRIFHSLYGLETLTLRYFNVYGPRQNAGSPYSGVISLFVTSLLAGKQARHLRRRPAEPRLHLRRGRRPGKPARAHARAASSASTSTWPPAIA